MSKYFGFSAQEAHERERDFLAGDKDAKRFVALCLQCNKPWEPRSHQCETRGLIENLHLDEICA